MIIQLKNIMDVIPQTGMPYIKMKNKILFSLIAVFIIAGIVIAIIMPNINLRQELTQEEKQFVWNKCKAKRVIVFDCWKEGECYFCDYAFWNNACLNPEKYNLTNEQIARCNKCRFRKRAITCNYEEDRKVYNETGDWIANYTKKDLVKLDIIELIKAHTKTKTKSKEAEMIFNETWD